MSVRRKARACRVNVLAVQVVVFLLSLPSLRAFHGLQHPIRSKAIQTPASLSAFRSRDGRHQFDSRPRPRNHLHRFLAPPDNGNESSLPVIGKNTVDRLKPRVYPERWIQLAYLSLLALMSDWICFSVAANPDTYESVYAGHSAAALIDLFLFTNVASCFLVTDVVAKIGLQRSIQGSAILMTIGCWLRAGISVDTIVSYPAVVLGTVLVGAAQPFFQCTPPLVRT
jgi:hypothetical protein